MKSKKQSNEDKLRELYKRAAGTLMSLTDEEEALWADSPSPGEPTHSEKQSESNTPPHYHGLTSVSFSLLLYNMLGLSRL
jgi:hypothetical protein